MASSVRFSRGFAEIVLIVAEVSRSATFYRDVVGLIPETEVSPEWAWFWAGEPGISQRLALHRGPLLFEEHSPLPLGTPRFGPIHFAFAVESTELEAAAAKVRCAGVTVYGPTRLEWMRAVSYYFYDPDGNLLEWWSRDPDTAPPSC
ncbi:MAG: VOC family protein [Cytophagales bacterium]|nr:VOC family protein [Armatimonadota bacterium]